MLNAGYYGHQRRGYINFIGKIWMPAITAAQEIALYKWEVDQIIDRSNADGKITREGIAEWLSLHSGDFQGVDDFYAVIDDEEFGWEEEESAFTFGFWRLHV